MERDAVPLGWLAGGWIISSELQPTVLFFCSGNKAVKQQSVSLKITAALSVFFYRQSSNRAISVVDGVLLMIIVVSLSIFTTFLLEFCLKNRFSNKFLCRFWISQ